MCSHVVVRFPNSMFEAFDPAKISQVLEESLKDLTALEAFQVCCFMLVRTMLG